MSSIKEVKIDELSTKVTDLNNLGVELHKIYPYDMTGMKTEDGPSFGSNTISLVAISPTFGEEMNMIEENGYFHFNMYFSESDELENEVNSNTQLFGSSTTVISKKIGITNNFVLEGDTIPKVCFIDEPFNRTEFEAGNQVAYFMMSVNQVNDDNLIDNYSRTKIVNSETLSEIVLQDFRAHEQNYANSKIMFYENKDGFVKNPTIDIKGKQVPGFRINLDSNSLLGSVVARAHSNNIDANIDLIGIGDGLVPIKASPRDTQEEVNMYIDWFDYGLYMPYVEAIKFCDSNGFSIYDYLGQDDVAFQLIADLLAINYMFNSEFGGVDRITPSGGAAGTGMGQIDSACKLGYANLNILEISGKNAYQVSDSRWKFFLAKNPNYDNNKLQRIKRLIVALSRYVSSSFAVAMGNTAAVAGVAPWYLTLTSAINVIHSPSDSKSFILDNTNPKAFLESKYFVLDFNAAKNKITMPQTVELNELKYINSDQKMFIPKVPEIISAIDKETMAGKMLNGNNKAMAFQWYLPVASDTAFHDLYGNQPGTPVPSHYRKTFNLPQSEYGHYHDKSNLKQEIIDYAKKHFAPRAQSIDWVSSGSEVKVISGNKNLTRHGIELWDAKNQWDHDSHFYKTFPYSDNILSKFYPMKNAGSFPWINEFVKYNLSKLFPGKNYDPNSFTLKSIVGSEYSYYDVSQNIWVRLVISFTLGADYYENVVVQINGAKKPVFKEDRNVLFNKMKWREELQQFKVIPAKQYQVNITSEYEISELQQITIVSLWNDVVEIKVGKYEFKIPCYNKIDETITGMRIVFT